MTHLLDMVEEEDLKAIAAFNSLTERQQETLFWFYEMGADAVRVCMTMCISRATYKNHMSWIYRKFRLTNGEYQQPKLMKCIIEELLPTYTFQIFIEDLKRKHKYGK